MLKRGLRFEVPNKYGTFISIVLKSIAVNDYDWILNHIEVHSSNKNDDDLWNENQPFILSGEVLKERIDLPNYYTVFGEFFAYPRGNQPKLVSSYEEFKESAAEIVLLIVDSVYYDIYCKDEELIEQLYSNAKDNNFSNIEYIDENDTRTRLSVW